MKRLTGSGRAKDRTLARGKTLFLDASRPILLLAALFFCNQEPLAAMQILDAVDHAELEAEVSDRTVSRIALVGDRIARVIRGPDSFVVEHDAARGDLYLRPADRPGMRAGRGVPREPLTLFVGTSAGFTYRLALKVAERGSAQILIRNAAAVSGPDLPGPGDGRVAALVALIRAVARRETAPGYAIETPSRTPDGDGLAAIEIWRGPRFTVRVQEAAGDLGTDAEALARRLAARPAAVWLAPEGSGPTGGRLVVAVDDAHRTGPAGEAR